MTEAIRQKASARRVLAILIGLLVTILALQGIASVKPGGFEAFAQTASPTPGSPVIKIINPDESTSDEISAKSDTVDSAYHLVAWVANLPATPTVQFKYIPDGTNREQTIICQETGTESARQVGNDTFECRWNLAGVSDGAGTVRAILFSGTTSVSQDDEPVTIDSTGQTLEIVYPVNGGLVGFYTRPNGVSSGIITVRTSGPNNPEGDEGTQRVEVYYSTSPPGSEPQFIPCGNDDTTGGTQDNIRCDLAENDPATAADENDDPAEVTAIAAVPGDTDEGPLPPPPTGPDPDATPDIDAADAHRAFGYEQDPNTVLLTPQTQQKNAGQCSDVITATVVDTNGRIVVGVNVDVHAQGPTDNLSFDGDAGDETTSESKPPEGHTAEAAVDCETATATTPPEFAGEQGDHDRIDADIKHIESLDAGTSEEGQFRFKLYSPHAGTTQYTVWADEDGNDQFCSAEAAGNGSVGWSTTAPSPTGLPAEQTTCPKPTPGQTASPTATATATATSTTTATPTGTTTTTTGGPTTDRTVTLAADKNEMPAGRTLTLSGQILSNDESCTDNEFVRIRRRILGTTTFEDLFATRTDSQGRFSVETRPRRSADYIAVATAHDNCQEDTSGEVTVLVKVLIQILPSDENPDRGDRIRFKSSVRPQHDGTTLLLQRKKGRRWVTVDRDRLNNRSIGNFTVRANFGSRTFRTRWRSQDAEHESNTSRAVTIRTT